MVHDGTLETKTHTQKKQDSKDEAEQGVKVKDSAHAMMALLPLKESKGMHRRRSKAAQMKQKKKASWRRAVLTP